MKISYFSYINRRGRECVSRMVLVHL